MQIHSKLPAVGTSIFTVMSALAARHNAVNLGQGFPDFPMSPELIELVSKAMKDGYNQYTPMQGHLPLREIIAEKVSALYTSNINPDSEITITPGGTYAIYTALTTVLQPGDEVIIFEPAYDSYVPTVIANGARPVLINLQFPDYKIDWEEVRKRITSRTRVVMINSPHNPSGSVLTKSDMLELSAIVRDTNILILSDEVYEHLVYDQVPHQSILRYPELMSRAFVCFSFGKVYHCTGWKLGYCIAPAEMMAEFRKLHQYNCFSCHTPSQIAIAEFLKDPQSYLSLSGFLQEKRDYFIKLMKKTRFDLLSSSGSYFICATYNRISQENDQDLVKRMTTNFGVAAIPVSAFYQQGTDNKVIRFCFAKRKETLESAVEQLSKI